MEEKNRFSRPASFSSLDLESPVSIIHFPFSIFHLHLHSQTAFGCALWQSDQIGRAAAFVFFFFSPRSLASYLPSFLVDTDTPTPSLLPNGQTGVGPRREVTATPRSVPPTPKMNPNLSLPNLRV